MIALEEDGGVVLEIEVEERNHSGVTIALKIGKRLLSDLKHNISMEFEEDFRRSVLPFLFHLP